MENNPILGRKGPSRRVFLYASAATAVAAPLVARTVPAGAAQASTGSALAGHEPDHDLRAMLRHVDPDRIQATVLRLTQFGTRHTASSQTDPVRGIEIGRAHV